MDCSKKYSDSKTQWHIFKSDMLLDLTQLIGKYMLTSSDKWVM